jgi:hypothetical protein
MEIREVWLENLDKEMVAVREVCRERREGGREGGRDGRREEKRAERRVEDWEVGR